MDILYTKNVDTFCIVTSDCDFTPLVTRILSEGKSVIGFGQRKTPSVFVNACSTFLFLDEEDKTKSKESTVISNDIKSNTKLVKLLRNAIITTKEENGWSKLSRVGTLITNHVSFDSRNYGYSRLSDLIAAINIFELKRDESKHFVARVVKK